MLWYCGVDNGPDGDVALIIPRGSVGYLKGFNNDTAVSTASVRVGEIHRRVQTSNRGQRDVQ
jgi:hypothetical protein